MTDNEPVDVDTSGASGSSVSGDVILIGMAEEFVRAEKARDTLLAGFADVTTPWQPDMNAEFDRLLVVSPDYHQNLCTIFSVKPETIGGLVAQANVLLWHLKNTCDDDTPALIFTQYVIGMLNAKVHSHG